MNESNQNNSSRWEGLKALLRDPIFLIPIAFLIGFELFLHTGLYRHLLQPRSYAENVNRIIQRVENSSIKPDILILGTSVAYQGVQVKQLNEILRPHGLSVLSGASEGAKLITQHMIFKELRPKLPNLKMVLHITEENFPSTIRYGIDQPNLSMLNQFSRPAALELIRDYQFHPNLKSRLTFYLRSLAYQRDLRDFVLDPLDRIKGISRRFKEPHSDYAYENHELYAMSAYPAKSLKECMDVASKGITPPDQAGNPRSDHHHNQAVYTTCRLAQKDPMAVPGQDQWNALFQQRLKLFHDEATRSGLKVATLIAPYVNLIKDPRSDEKIGFWRSTLQEIYGKERYYFSDMRRSLDGAHNLDYYYDTIHLNRVGAEKFTARLGKELIRLAQEMELTKKSVLGK